MMDDHRSPERWAHRRRLRAQNRYHGCMHHLLPWRRAPDWIVQPAHLHRRPVLRGRWRRSRLDARPHVSVGVRAEVDPRRGRLLLLPGDHDRPAARVGDQ